MDDFLQARKRSLKTSEASCWPSDVFMKPCAASGPDKPQVSRCPPGLTCPLQWPQLTVDSQS